VALGVEGPVRVLRNVGARGRSLTITLAGRGANTHGVGAIVTVESAVGTQRREIGTSAGYQAAKPASAHVGLGDAASATLVEVRWPSGAVSTLRDVAAGTLVVREPERELEAEQEDTDE
ncbi:MAG: ASPIC/UnbV domain-containing protein, partial [Planctomycetota bacterium]